MTPAENALGLCILVSRDKEISNATARLAAWFIGAAARAGGFPLELSLSNIRDGFATNDDFIDGTGSRIETLKNSIEWLEAHGVLSSIDGKKIGFGYSSRLYTMEVK